MERAESFMALDGEWSFSLTPTLGDMSDTVILPGTTDTNGKGISNGDRAIGHLSRRFVHVGPAWYSRQVAIPPEWSGRRLRLVMERTKDSRVYVDGRYAGNRDSLCTPHVLDLTNLMNPGEHRITVVVDNSNLPPVGDPHQLTEQTQTNWNGILGNIGLEALPAVWIEGVRIFPDLPGKRIKVSLDVRNATGKGVKGDITLSAESCNSPVGHCVPPVSAGFVIPEGEASAIILIEYALGEDVLLWDGFTPNLYTLSASLKAFAGDNGFADSVLERFGMRDFGVKGTQFQINGLAVFLRGKHDACVFPLTGFAPMDKEEWVRILSIAKSYGINHYRFHTWCPPEAAFDAADEVGIYMQPELPNWASILAYDHPEGDPAHIAYLREEGLRILDAFGNHPSFVMFSLGNELWGSRDVMGELIRGFRAHDPRHLYAQGSNNFFHFPKLSKGDDYWTTMRTVEGGGMVRGSCAYSDVPLGHVQDAPPSTMTDFGSAIEGVTVPVIGHETGQYQVYPDFKGISKYSGVLRPGNLEIYQERLREKGMSDQAEDFVKASGSLAVTCYREDIEAALRTRGFGGFQLLDLQDFPGQGTALVGILDSFMDSKGLIEPNEWMGFCSDLVPLLRMEKRSWIQDEVFEAAVEVANYSGESLTQPVVTVDLSDGTGRILDSETLRPQGILQGTVTGLGMVRFHLGSMDAPGRLTISVRVEGDSGTIAVNRYSIWVFPVKVGVEPAEGIRVRRLLDPETLSILEGGGKVLLIPETTSLEGKGECVGGSFASDFWCFPMFKADCERRGKPVSPGTLGILCDPMHPSLAGFPTEGHSDWQWWPINMHSRPAILDGAPEGFRPLVQVIDNPDRNHRLGLVFEAKVGQGRLLVCCSDLIGDSDAGIPESRQLLHSLLAYMGSPKFDPIVGLDMEFLTRVLP